MNHGYHHQQIIGAAIPEDVRVREKEDEKEEKHQDLAREVRKMWKVRTKVVPVVVAALGSIPLRLKDNLRTTEMHCCGQQKQTTTCCCLQAIKELPSIPSIAV